MCARARVRVLISLYNFIDIYFSPENKIFITSFSAASFSETFYGLKRVTVINSKLQEKLSHKEQILSLILIVIFPYLKNKLVQFISKYKLQEIDSCTSREVS